jgi:SAM-dependent methyltransferase
MPELSHCPLCGGSDLSHFHSDRRRQYRRCKACCLVFVPREYYLDRLAERAEYDKHQNDVDDPGYRRFLSRLAIPVLERLMPASQGLDFGCGPGPALAQMFSEAGHSVALYDVYYEPDERVLQREYDFICATEVVEHLHHPLEVLSRLWDQLLPGGHLGIMTKMVRDQQAFQGWHYKNDPTHVCFFSRDTWRWWAIESGAKLEFFGDDVVLFEK